MRERILDIYKEKAPSYLTVLNQFDKAGVEYVLLNLLVADDNPGDLDVLICNCHQTETAQILVDNGFSYYTKYEKGQYLWNKYLNGIGFVQIHIYESLHVCGREYFAASKINKKLQKDTIFNFFVFLIETLYKGKLRFDQYQQYKTICDVDMLLEFVQDNSPLYIDSVKYILRCYENKVEINNNEIQSLLWKGNSINKYRIVLWKLFRRFINLFRRDNISVLFIGIDGAGKSTQIEKVYKIFSKGGIFPVSIYLGLKNSMFSPKERVVEKKTENPMIEQENHVHPLTFLRFSKLMLYWLEYNIKYLLKIKLHPYGSRTTYLIDRCFFDLLYYYPYSIINFLFIKLSFVPDRIIFLSGNEEMLYERKKEMGRPKFHTLYNFYTDLAACLVHKYKKNVKVVDTTKISIESATYDICDYIMTKLDT